MANAIASHVFDRELMRRGLHVTQVGALELIWRNEPITPTELTELVGHPPTTVRDRIQTLVRHGYVQRVPNQEDRRSHLLATTPEGEEYLRAALPVVRAAEEHIGQHLGTPFEDYRAPLEALLRAARAALAEARAGDPRPTPSSDA
jgi:DNA-binding MarR family transcriptional regulator